MNNMIIRHLLLLLGLARCSPTVSSFQLSREEFTKIQQHPSNTVPPEVEACDQLYSRRKVFSQAMSLGIGLSAMSVLPSETRAAGPITSKETDSLGVLFKRALRPKPLKILRQKLSQDFAVLLMRSSYNSLDELDCVAMDQFQRDFFLIRRSEYEPYVKSLGPGLVQQGDLTDPYYFDFISFAQYETINREISQNPPFVFEEQQPVDQGDDKPQKFVSVLIKRKPSLTNDMLGPEHSRLVGSAILDRLEETFGGTGSALPKVPQGSRPNAEILLSAVQQLVNLFLINGYAMGGSVSIVPSDSNQVSSSGAKIIISLNAPVTLWGGTILQMEGATLNNNFLQKTVTELLKRAGYLSNSQVKYDGLREELTITVV